MQVVHTFDELAASGRDVFLAIGVFDGLHLGHQRVIGQARDDARAGGGAAVVLTFDPHPLRVLQPDKAPRLLTATPHKLRLIAALNVEACLVLNFDRPFSLLSPEEFIALVARPANRVREICVGTRFRFGHNRAGDVRLIAKLAPTCGFAAKEITPVKLGEEMISSTAVRQHVLRGHLDRAAAMLGRPFSISGPVERGDGVGRQLGYPTANLDLHGEVLPPDGVYAARALLGQQTLGGVVNIGTRPTFANRSHQRVCEVHLFEFDRDIYQQDLEVIFVRKLRDEQKFESVDALRRQLAQDAATARTFL